MTTTDRLRCLRCRWEYLTLAATSDERALNALGAEGWELAACVPYTGGFQLIFKRRVRLVDVS